MWNIIHGSSDITFETFWSHFDGIQYSGTTSLTNSKTQLNKTVLYTGTSAQSKWSQDIVEKIKSQLIASPTTLEDIFTSIDTDNSGKLSAVEFRNGIWKLCLGLTSREIDQLMIRLDTNQDGMIDYKEFMNKFAPSRQKEVDLIIWERARGKLDELYDMMGKHMHGALNGFSMFDNKTGVLTYSDFCNLVAALFRAAYWDCPTY